MAALLERKGRGGPTCLDRLSCFISEVLPVVA
jgi:hypothetical protein